jgi:hypothetical protein
MRPSGTLNLSLKAGDHRNMASKWMSRKLVVAVTAVIAEVILGLGGSVELAQELSLAIAGIASAYLIGQSAVDARNQK